LASSHSHARSSSVRMALPVVTMTHIHAGSRAGYANRTGK
jgi:hypothetical protein